MQCEVTNLGHGQIIVFALPSAALRIRRAAWISCGVRQSAAGVRQGDSGAGVLEKGPKVGIRGLPNQQPRTIHIVVG